MTHYTTPLRRARGLGSAKRGVGHFIGQRVSAVALLLLSPWAVWSAVILARTDYTGARAWLARPVDATLLLLLAFAGLYHGRLGLQVIIEDYIGHGLGRAALLILNTFVALAAAALIAICILRVSLGVGTV
jgi:succinate dehydrogenase / fumarate reductase membrane anchor subunit